MALVCVAQGRADEVVDAALGAAERYRAEGVEQPPRCLPLLASAEVLAAVGRQEEAHAVIAEAWEILRANAQWDRSEPELYFTGSLSRERIRALAHAWGCSRSERTS